MYLAEDISEKWNTKMTTVILFGASGYIGQHLEQNMLARGWRVIKVTHREIHNYNYGLEFSISERNVLETTENLSKFIDGNSKIYAINVAGITRPPQNSLDIQKIYAANSVYIFKIISLLRRLRVKYFINTGSYWQYDSDGLMRYESVYIRSKNITTTYLRDIADPDLRICELVLYDVFGLDDPRGKLLNRLKLLHADETIHLSSGKQEICYVNIKDICSAYIHCVEKMKLFFDHTHFSLIPIVSKDVRELKDYIGQFLSYHPSKPSLKWGERIDDTSSPQKIWRSNIAWELLEWTPQAPFEHYAKEFFNVQ